MSGLALVSETPERIRNPWHWGKSFFFVQISTTTNTGFGWTWGTPQRKYTYTCSFLPFVGQKSRYHEDQQSKSASHLNFFKKGKHKSCKNSSSSLAKWMCLVCFFCPQIWKSLIAAESAHLVKDTEVRNRRTFCCPSCIQERISTLVLVYPGGWRINDRVHLAKYWALKPICPDTDMFPSHKPWGENDEYRQGLTGPLAWNSFQSRIPLFAQWYAGTLFFFESSGLLLTPMQWLWKTSCRNWWLLTVHCSQEWWCPEIPGRETKKERETDRQRERERGGKDRARQRNKKTCQQTKTNEDCFCKGIWNFSSRSDDAFLCLSLKGKKVSSGLFKSEMIQMIRICCSGSYTSGER